MKRKNKLDNVIRELETKNPSLRKEVNTEEAILESAVLIATERKARGWTQQKLAGRAGVPQATVARIENGQNTSIETIMKLANGFEKKLVMSFE